MVVSGHVGTGNQTPNLGPLQKQQVLFIAEPSLQACDCILGIPHPYLQPVGPSTQGMRDYQVSQRGQAFAMIWILSVEGLVTVCGPFKRWAW